MNQIRTAVDVVASDLASITDRLAVEFEQLSGHNLVVAGGAGFLGHYLIQAALHWNNTHADVPPVNVTVLDNFIRGVPDWLTALNGNPNLRLIKHDITNPLPAELGDARLPDPRRVDRVADLSTGSIPIETMDANVNGLRFMLDYCLAQQAARASRSRRPVLLEQRDLRRPDAGEHPDARDLPRQRLVHRAARVLRRVEALRRDAVRQLRAAARRARSRSRGRSTTTGRA